METELRRLHSSHSSSIINTPSSSTASIRTGTDVEDFRYTSLKDIIASESVIDCAFSPTAAFSFSTDRHHSSAYIINDFNLSTISIKNHLVKHAASAYLQSAAVLAARDQSWLTRLLQQQQQSLRRVRQRGSAVGLAIARWRECMWQPVEVCMGFVRRMVSCVASQIVVARSRTSISFNS